MPPYQANAEKPSRCVYPYSVCVGHVLQQTLSPVSICTVQSNMAPMFPDELDQAELKAHSASESAFSPMSLAKWGSFLYPRWSRLSEIGKDSRVMALTVWSLSGCRVCRNSQKFISPVSF